MVAVAIPLASVSAVPYVGLSVASVASVLNVTTTPLAGLPSAFLTVALTIPGLAPEIDWLLIGEGLASVEALTDTRSIYSFNLSLDTLREPSFVPRLSARLHDKPALAPFLCFEIPERALSALPFVVQELQARLRPLGVRFGLDQVGNDASTLYHLKSLHFDFVKLDSALLPELEKQIERKLYIRTLSDLAHSVECQVIATGVESEAQMALTCELGVDAVQGKVIAEPVPIRAL